jgi:hypothetical protein
MECFEVGDSFRGYRIRAEARKISDPQVIAKTGRHKAQCVILTENCRSHHRAKAWMDSKVIR